MFGPSRADLGVARKFAAGCSGFRNGDRCPLIRGKGDRLCVTFASELKNDTGDIVLRVRRQTARDLKGLIEKTGARLDARGNIVTNENYLTSLEGVYAAGDARRGASLVVWAIAEGRRAARAIDENLMGSSLLPN